MRRRAPSATLLHPYNPVRSRGKILAQTSKKKKREKGKAMSHARDKKKTNYTNDARDLVSTRKETLVKNSQSLRKNPTLVGENRLPQGNKKFGPPSSSIERKHQTRMASKNSSVMNKKGKSTR